MTAKPTGKCSYCKKEMTPIIIEGNFYRRDKCKCSLCKEIVYLCRYPGCHNYVMGGKHYDDEFCFFCTQEISKATGSLIKGCLSKASLTAIGITVTAWLKSKDK